MNVSTSLSFLPPWKVSLGYLCSQLPNSKCRQACLRFYTEVHDFRQEALSLQLLSLVTLSSSAQSWERKWLPSVVSPENYAISSDFPTPYHALV